MKLKITIDDGGILRDAESKWTRIPAFDCITRTMFWRAEKSTLKFENVQSLLAKEFPEYLIIERGENYWVLEKLITIDWLGRVWYKNEIVAKPFYRFQFKWKFIESETLWETVDQVCEEIHLHHYLKS